MRGEVRGTHSLPRWMAKVLYTHKVRMFRSQFKITAREETGLKFIALLVKKKRLREYGLTTL